MNVLGSGIHPPLKSAEEKSIPGFSLLNLSSKIVFLNSCSVLSDIRSKSSNRDFHTSPGNTFHNSTRIRPSSIYQVDSDSLTREWNLHSMNWRAVGSFLGRTCILVGKIEISGLKAVQQFQRVIFMFTCCTLWIHVRLIPPVAQLCSRMSLFIRFREKKFPAVFRNNWCKVLTCSCSSGQHALIGGNTVCSPETKG